MDYAIQWPPNVAREIPGLPEELIAQVQDYVPPTLVVLDSTYNKDILIKYSHGAVKSFDRFPFTDIERVAMSPAGTLFAVAGVTGSVSRTYRFFNVSTVCVVDIASQKCVMNVETVANITHLAFSTCSTMVACAMVDEMDDCDVVCVYNVATGMRVAQIDGFERCYGLQFSPNGVHVAINTFTSIQVWHVQQQVLLYDIPRLDYRVLSFAYSPDGQYLATCDYSVSLVHVLDARTGQVLCCLQAPNRARPERVLFAPDNRRLTAVYHDGSIYVFDLVAGTCVLQPYRAGATYCGLAFDDAGRRLAVGTYDTVAVTMWEVI